MTDGQRLKVMLIDDDESQFVITQALIEEEGDSDIDLQWASSPNEALGKMEREEYDVFLLDYHLGNVDGLTFLRNHRERVMSSSGVIMLTGQGNEDIAAGALKLGVNDYLRKSNLTSAKLRESVHQVFEKVRERMRREDERRELERLATKDELTGLYNRRALFDRLVLEFSRTRRHHHAMSIVFIDLDHFKRVNDLYGHIVGDHVLCGISRLITQCVRGIDVVGRFGGEEICIGMPETPMRGAKILTERIREKIARLPFHLNGDRPFHITCSMGIAESDHSQDERLLELMARADAALYQAKSDGRNCVRVSNPKAALVSASEVA